MLIRYYILYNNNVFWEYKKMNERIRERLLQKTFRELCQLRSDQYCSKEEVVDDILAHDDDGSVQELVQTEGSFLWLMLKSSGKKGLGCLIDDGKETKNGEGQKKP